MNLKKQQEKNWYWLDANGKVLGRLATQISNILQGKDNPNREDYLDSGDYVIVTNTKKVLLTGNKLKNKIYYNHSQYPGGLRKRTAKTMIEKYPNEVIFLAVKGMLKKSKLGAKQIKKLFLYPYEAHKHEAQSPVKLT